MQSVVRSLERRRILRETNEDKARRFPKEGAGMLTSLTETDGLVELPEDLTRLEPGTEVNFVPYSELI